MRVDPCGRMQKGMGELNLGMAFRWNAKIFAR